jgi:hypothetical protein
MEKCPIQSFGGENIKGRTTWKNLGLYRKIILKIYLKTNRMGSGLVQFPQNGDMCWTFLNIVINRRAHKMQIIFHVAHMRKMLTS